MTLHFSRGNAETGAGVSIETGSDTLQMVYEHLWSLEAEPVLIAFLHQGKDPLWELKIGPHSGQKFQNLVIVPGSSAMRERERLFQSMLRRVALHR